MAAGVEFDSPKRQSTFWKADARSADVPHAALAATGFVYVTRTLGTSLRRDVMEFAGYGLVAITALVAILWILRMMSRAKRKDETAGR